MGHGVPPLFLFPLLLWPSACVSPPEVVTPLGHLQMEHRAISPDLRASLRGLSVVDGEVVWAGGSGGLVARTVNGGRDWEQFSIPGAHGLDFRDVHALGAQQAWAMAAGSGDASRVYATRDGGRTWTLQLTNPDADGFFDAIAFWDAARGLLIGDPIDGRLTLYHTEDGGEHWQRLAPEASPPMAEGEFAFAASGTCLVTAGKLKAWIATGGSRARILRSTDGGRTWIATSVPFRSGAESQGIFSIAFADEQNGMAVGGDFSQPSLGRRNLLISNDGGAHWSSRSVGLPGYRSCVAPLLGDARAWIAVGSGGADWSWDGGESWNALALAGYHVVQFDRTGVGWALGSAATTPVKIQFQAGPAPPD